MIISLIAAMAENRVIGRNNRIPWDLPGERRRYRNITMGHPIIMGRRTHESIGRALPGRKNIIITRDPRFHADGCFTAHSLAKALELASGADETFISGGAEIYAAGLPLADRIYLTVIHRDFDGDARFPEIPADFHVVSSEEIMEEGIAYTCLLMVRRAQ